MQDHFEYVACGICGETNARQIYQELHDPLFDTPGSFSIVQCLNCGLIYTNPRPTIKFLHTYYPENYPSYFNVQKDFPSKLKKVLEIIFFYPYKLRYGKKISQRLQPSELKRCLEIGCGKGELLYKLKELGWEVTGIEPSPIAAEIAKSLLGENRVIQGTLESVNLPKDNYDLVILWHSLEHLNDPKGNLQIINRSMKSGSLLRIGLPKIDSVEARIFGRYWVNLDVPRHLYHFSIDTLSTLLKATGYRIIDTFPQVLPGTISSSIIFLFRQKYNLSLPTIFHRMLNVSILPIAGLIYVLGQSGNIDVWAVKET